ncbi:Glycine cleavage system transcriptional activator [Cupriavidus laharis]|uniref:Glycine cleavage system transcriptional activator n=1 Tax=Cupriavidus laharis TaxID=151654 RepID=A0ABM8XUC6_9BURK|nr:transcriptional regulator GcvA [Cupriavidus laharis]CAG9183964.1 Glycine cleavage system transcriptional activator [Cupriavidus laharis]
MSRLPPLNSIRAFEAAGRHLSFTRAAEELCVTHGAVSHQVKTLEEWLGVPLFRRLGQSVQLTDQGRLYLATVSPALSAIASASRSLSRHEVLRVNALPSFIMRWLFPRLVSFRAAHPTIEVDISSGLEPVEELSGDIDVIIRREPDTVPGLVKRKFIPEMHFPVCAPSLLKDGRLEGIGDLRHHTLLHCQARPTVWNDWLKAFWQDSLVPAQSLQLEHLYFALQAALDGLGVAMGPSSLVASDVASGRLVIPFGRRMLPCRNYFMILRQERQHDPVVKTFCDWLEREGEQFESDLGVILEKVFSADRYC